MQNSHAKGDRIFIISWKSGFDLANTFGVLADHRRPIAVWQSVVFFHFDLFEVKLR
jgi:hypothetical protein